MGFQQWTTGKNKTVEKQCLTLTQSSRQRRVHVCMPSSCSARPLALLPLVSLLSLLLDPGMWVCINDITEVVRTSNTSDAEKNVQLEFFFEELQVTLLFTFCLPFERLSIKEATFVEMLWVRWHCYEWTMMVMMVWRCYYEQPSLRCNTFKFLALLSCYFFFRIFITIDVITLAYYDSIVLYFAFHCVVISNCME